MLLGVFFGCCCHPANIPYLWHKGRDFIKRDQQGHETKVGLIQNFCVCTHALYCDKGESKRAHVVLKDSMSTS